ncbi:HIT domain-containing protein [Candidatus Babeliales bacterium]|nr:HIT domain-containing protein [Candidatus Babeliales bacterium]
MEVLENLSASCIFCKIIQGTLPAKKITENECVVVVQDITPKAPIHYLIIPKKHIADMSALTPTDNDFALAMVNMVTELSTTLATPPSFNIVSNNGRASGQSVFHLHWHFLAGRNVYEQGLKL